MLIVGTMNTEGLEYRGTAVDVPVSIKILRDRLGRYHLGLGDLPPVDLGADVEQRIAKIISDAQGAFSLIEQDIDQDAAGTHGATVRATSYAHLEEAVAAVRRSCADVAHVEDRAGRIVYPEGAGP